ncbi:MAG: enoyl-CoA hydratase/isomerase family protein [Ignavibacteriaceae bacterium]|nr:enoyl-CoA hydratase/isomerase family protein [Ignavibacteriaceae bacterium]
MIKYEIKNEIGILTLNRPEKRNALHPELVKQMKNKLKEVEKDESVKVLIITGEGKAFCAGADLEYLNEMRNYSSLENEKDSRELAELFVTIYNFPKPVIAAVNGTAIAGGCGLASVCDIIIADELNAKFGYSEVKIGFLPAIVSTFLIRRVGEGMAKQLLLTGEIIEAKRAYEIGFVNSLSDNALEFSLDFASKLKSNSDSSMKMTKELIRKVSGLSVEDAVEYSIGLNTISRTSEDFKEGLKKFLTKK